MMLPWALLPLMIKEAVMPAVVQFSIPLDPQF